MILGFILFKLVLAEEILTKRIVYNGKHKGKCLDGSLPGYYQKELDISMGVRLNNVLLSLPKGPWCYELEPPDGFQNTGNSFCSIVICADYNFLDFTSIFYC